MSPENQNAGNVADHIPSADPLALLESLPAGDPLLAEESEDDTSTVEITSSPSSSGGHDTGITAGYARILSGVRFGLYYCLVSAGVFAVLQVATNFVAYSELAMNFMDPSRYEASGQHLTHQIAQAQVAVLSTDINSTSTGSTARSKILERRLETAALDDRSLDVLSAIRETNPYSPVGMKTTEVSSLDIDIVPYENRIIIPRIGKNIPIVDIDANSGVDFNNLENIFMKELERGVVRYPGTAQPGQTGNAFIFGHSSNYPWLPGEYNQVFAMLDKLVFGDEIIVYYHQKKYVYVVREKQVVKPGNVKSLERDDTKAELSLMTCWPLGTSLNRLLVFAELQSDSPASAIAIPADHDTDQ
ncbi:MAG TPA: class E sortase [bacterium]|nr:class E sortase [bacterium]